MPSFTELFTVSLWRTDRKFQKAPTPIIEANYQQIIDWYVEQSTLDNNIQNNVSNIQFTYLKEGVFQLMYTAEDDETVLFMGLDDPGNIHLAIDGQTYRVSWLPLQAHTERFTIYLDEVEVEIHANHIINWFKERMQKDSIRSHAFNIQFIHIADEAFQIKCVIDGTQIGIPMLVNPDEDGSYPLEIGGRNFHVQGHLF